MEFPIDPSMLNKPLSELVLPESERTNDHINVQNTEVFQDKKTEEGTDTDPSPKPDEEGKVPYRRFKKFHDRALDAEREAEFWRQKAMEPQQRPEPRQDYYQMPEPSSTVQPRYEGGDWDRFKALFVGADEQAVKSAYRLEVERIAAVEERAMRRAVETFEQRTTQQQEAYRENRSMLDQWTEEAADSLGRDLNQEEEMAILDIMEEYSPKDRDGNIQAVLPAEKAVEIYEMQQARQRSPKREARNAIASMSGGSSGGDTSVAQTAQEANANYQPGLGWRANFQRITGKNPNNI